MKKLSLLLPLVIMTACTTNHNTQANHAEMQAPSQFACEQGGMVEATYAEDGNTAYLKVTIPQANIKQAPVELTRDVSGSGERYVNEINPDEVYEWQTKANDGIFVITKSDSKPFTMVCRAS